MRVGCYCSNILNDGSSYAYILTQIHWQNISLLLVQSVKKTGTDEMPNLSLISKTERLTLSMMNKRVPLYKKAEPASK